MNLDKIRAKLGALNNPKGGNNGEKREKVDMTKYLWKPKAEGKYIIRIVPSKFDKESPFKEVFLHYGYSKFPIYALTNWGEKDPIVELAKELRAAEYDIENWRLAKKLDPKMRIFVPVIVRGEEEKGVRLWEFGKEVYAQLLSIAEDEDYGDYTDLTEGRDFTITAVKSVDLNGREGLKSTIQIKPKTSPLSTDVEQVETWLDDQPNILDLQKVFKYTFEKLKGALEKFLEPEGATSASEESSNEATSDVTENDTKSNSNDDFLKEMNATNVPEVSAEVEKPKVKKPPVAKAVKGKSKADKFNELFDDKK